MIVNKISINILGREEISYGFELVLSRNGETVWREYIRPSTYGAPNVMEFYPKTDADQFAFRSFDTEVASRYGHYVEINYDTEIKRLNIFDTPPSQWSNWQILNLIYPKAEKAIPLVMLGLLIGGLALTTV